MKKQQGIKLQGKTDRQHQACEQPIYRMATWASTQMKNRLYSRRHCRHSCYSTQGVKIALTKLEEPNYCSRGDQMAGSKRGEKTIAAINATTLTGAILGSTIFGFYSPDENAGVE